jgi:hypothetical protein
VLLLQTDEHFLTAGLRQLLTSTGGHREGGEGDKGLDWVVL